MYGPPGCGKTHLARATAGEISAGLHFRRHQRRARHVDWQQRTQSARDLFEQARRNPPCVLFFDEVDALGAQPQRHEDKRRPAFDQSVSFRDGRRRSEQRGRADSRRHERALARRRRRFADRGDSTGSCSCRRRMPRPAAKFFGSCATESPRRDIDHAHVAKKTPDFSGADLKAVVDLAIEAKLRRR